MWDSVRNQLRSVIEWDDVSSNQLFHRWTDRGDEIKNASKLIIGPGQGCIFVYEGKVRSMHAEEGMVDLQTANIPFWTTVKKFMQAFESEHKVGLFFFRRAKVLDQKWGTTSTIKYVDPAYNFPVGLKAFGSYSYRIDNPMEFFVNVLGGQADYSTDDFRSVMSDRILHPLGDFLAENKYGYNDIDAKRNEIGDGMAKHLDHEFDKFGFCITDFRIEGTSFDADTLERINRVAAISAEAAAAKAAGLGYRELQQIEALREAARNEGGAAGAGVGIGAGISLGQDMMGQMNAPAAAPSAPPSETGGESIVDKLSKLKKLFEAELITDNEYKAKKAELLAQL